MTRLSLQILLFMILLLAGCRSSHDLLRTDATYATSDAPTLVVAALSYELAPVVDAMHHTTQRRVFGVRCHEGTIAGRPMVVAEVGVGKVNAAASVAALIDRYKPSRVLMTGTAGSLSPELNVYDVIVGAETVQNDLGTQYAGWFEPWGAKNPSDGIRMPVYFKADPSLLERAEAITSARANVRIGTIASGDHFMSSAPHRAIMHQRFRSDVVDMESAAVAQVCYRRHIPFMAIRGVSDQTGESAVSAYRTHQREAAKMAAGVLISILDTSLSNQNNQ